MKTNLLQSIYESKTSPGGELEKISREVNKKAVGATKKFVEAIKSKGAGEAFLEFESILEGFHEEELNAFYIRGLKDGLSLLKELQQQEEDAA